VELKSPRKPFVAEAETRHPRVSAAVHNAISQAQDYRDWIIDNVDLRKDLERKGIFVCRPQILVILGRADPQVRPETMQVLHDRLHSGPIHARSYSDLLNFAKEHYQANRQIVVPSYHYELPLEKDALLVLLESLPNLYGLDCALVYVYDSSTQTVNCCAQVGLDQFEADIRDFHYSPDENSIVAHVLRHRRVYVSRVPTQDPRVDQRELTMFHIGSPVVAFPLVAQHMTVGCIVLWNHDSLGVDQELIQRLHPFVEILAAQIARNVEKYRRTEI
jgi:hypothetical protein